MRPDWIDNKAAGWETAGVAGGQQHWNDNSEWQEHVDEETGRYFYFSERTQDTQWIPPATGGYRPCAWRIQHDAATGRVYFAHKDTGESVWQLSAAAAATSNASGGAFEMNPIHQRA